VLLEVIKKHGLLPNLVNDYKERVDAMYSALTEKCSLSCYKPDGSFYLFPRLPENCDERLVASRLVESGVLVIPGSKFGAPGYLRFAALPNVEEIHESAIIIHDILKQCYS